MKAKFSEWEKLQPEILGAGDGYAGLNHLSKSCIDNAVKRYVMSGNGGGMCQATGLRDSKGTMIRLGDELCYIGTNMSSMEVKLENGCFVGEGPFFTRPLYEYITAADFQSIEITGNVYEK